ncbi:MAG: phenylalanine--tRNA ligase subunit beta [Solirubrobacterales bacterium]
MKVPLSWLSAYCDSGLSIETLADELAMHSIEVERISHAGTTVPEHFVVGRVVSAEQHPNADKLRVCVVDIGDGVQTIVCGAPNIAAGQTVPVALPGAVMPNGTKLGKAKLRGIESNGMILSEAELGVSDEHDGIAVLAENGDGPEPGTPLVDVVAISDPVIELEPTSNRVDCFGVYGVAREVRAITGHELAPAPWDEDAEPSGDDVVSDHASVTVESPGLCPRFTARVFKDVTIGPSPLWLKARLAAAGQRPINNIVDTTNYVMLMTAQPIHAFDLDRVPGGELIVRTATPGEKMTTLDGTERAFDEEMVLVYDREGPSGIAGIMGGQVSEVSEETASVLLEVATWNGVNILRTSRRLGLRSDASNRFEKQLHPEMAIRAQRIASKLIVELCGARLVPGTIDVAAEPPPPRRIALRSERVEGLLGMAIDPGRCEEYLRRLDFEVEPTEGGLEVVVPAHRYYDVTREADLIEEVGRIHGYTDQLPATLPDGTGQAGRLTREQRLRRRAEDVIRDLGFDGVVNISLTDAGVAERLRLPADDERARPITVVNPLSHDHSAMRTTLLSSLLDSAQNNLAHGADRVALSESGRAYLATPPTVPGTEVPGTGVPGTGVPGTGVAGTGVAGTGVAGPLGGRLPGKRPAPAYEPQRIAALAVGALVPSGWRDEPPAADFYALNGVLEALLTQLCCSAGFAGADEPFLHPGRGARIAVGGVDAGWIGEVHPLVCRAWDIEAAVGFELDLAPVAAASPLGEEHYEDVISFPAAHEDLAVVVGESVEAARVVEAIVDGGGELLRSARIFDVYRGDQIGEGSKSLAIRLEFRAPDRTLTDEALAERRAAITEALAGIGGSLRE